MNQYYILIPEKVKNELQEIDKYFKTLSIAGYNIDNLMEVISTVSVQTRKNDNKAQLQMQYINKLVPMGQLYMKGLISYGIIKRSGYYVTGESSYLYSFTEKYSSKYISYPLRNKKLIYRIEKTQKEFRHNASKTVRGRSEQVRYLKLLTIDEGYHEFIESDLTLSIDKYNNLVASATRIANNDIFYTVDDTSRRFHSNITNMAKDLRQFLRIDGKPLVNLDLKNSQPYLSIILLTDPGKDSDLTRDPNLAETLKNLKVSRAKDVKKYIKLVVAGELYEYLMREFSKGNLELSRTETKEQVLRILFAKNWMPKNEVNRKARKIFMANFPTVHRIFSKVRGRSKDDKFRSFKRFAILLQTIEAHLMLDVIVKRIFKEMPETIVMTIHDSIMTSTDGKSIEGIKQIMVEEFTRFIGYAPRISVEF
jgi:hypothetical protein